MAKGGHAVDDEHPVLGKRPINEVRLVIDELMALAEGAGTAAGVQALDCHDMLLRMAGKAPDDLLARCRSWLAGHEFEALAQALTSFIISNKVPIAAVDLALLGELLEPAGADVAVLGQIEVDDSDPLLFSRLDDDETSVG